MELIRLHKGEMTVGCEHTATLRPGGVYIIPPKVPHYAISGKEGAQWDVLMFDVRSFYNDTELCHSFLEPLFDRRAKFQLCTYTPEITACFDRTFTLTKENDFEVISQVYRLLALLFKHALVDISADVKGRHTITQATEYMKENLSEDLTTDVLARQFGYSQEYFCRLFKEVTQFTPMHYLKICRLERAVNLLNEGKHTVSEIASLCGFADPNYFTRCFKSFFGTTPTRMQKADR